MPEVLWPSSTEVQAAVAERIGRLLDECGGLVADFGRRTMSGGSGVLSERPNSLTPVLVSYACLSAGGDWRVSVWPAAGAEYMMAAADLFDDVADADPGGDAVENRGVLLTAAAGLLSLANLAVVRVIDDGASPTTAVALVTLLASGFAAAANGQSLNLQAEAQIDAVAAYRQTVAKSGPLGSLIARLGARTATDDAARIDVLGEFGRRLAVRSQLRNDARDVAPGATQLKADVRAGAHTVPLAFAGSRGAPRGLSDAEIVLWEERERARVAAAGGLVAANALAEAERLRAAQALDQLERLGCSVFGLRRLID